MADEGKTGDDTGQNTGDGGGENTGGDTGVATRPEHVAEEHWNAEKGEINTEALSQSYNSLRTKMSTKKTDDSISLPADETATILGDEAGLADMVKAAGLDPTDLMEKYMDKGKLSNADYAALKKGGWPKTAVNQFFQSQTDLHALQTKQVMADAVNTAGTKEKLSAVLKWGKESLSDEDKAYYEEQVKDTANGVRPLEWLISKYHAAAGAGSATSLLEGSAKGAVGSGPYTTMKEMHAAQNDSQYEENAAYRTMVNKRIALTPDSVLAGQG